MTFPAYFVDKLFDGLGELFCVGAGILDAKFEPKAQKSWDPSRGFIVVPCWWSGRKI